MDQENKKVNSHYVMAVLITVAAVIFIYGIVWLIGYVGKTQAAAAADKVQQGISRLQSFASAGQMINNRVPASYSMILKDCSRDCAYEISATTAEGREVIIEKGYLGNVYLRNLRPETGALRLTRRAEETSSTAGDYSLLEIGSLLSGRAYLATFDVSNARQPADFTFFDNKLPEAYLPSLSAGRIAEIEIASATASGIPKSVGIYWKKNGSSIRLSVNLDKTVIAEKKAVRSEVRSFDSQLASLCFDLTGDAGATYLATLTAQGTAGEAARDISLLVFKEFDCRGDNLPEGISRVNLIDKK